jgi:hypothetical protein
MSLSLVVLAAGVGSRYGGAKQLDRVGPGGSTLVDYAAYDARRAGFERLVLVVREGMETAVREAVGDRIARRFPVAYAVQPSSARAGSTSATGRSKPWGTGHATLAAASLVDGPFAVVNADDFYGASSYEVLARHLRQAAAGASAEHALVGFPLSETLSPDGPVSRAACTVDKGGCLTAIRELVKVERAGEGARFLDDDGSWRPLPGDTPVSLNFWGFMPEVLGTLERGFRDFLASNAASATAEYYLVSAVQALIDEGLGRVRVLGGGGPWAGLTHAGDRPRLVAMLAALTASGAYPADLWA